MTRILYTPIKEEIDDFKLSTSDFYQRHEHLGWIPKKNIEGRHIKEGVFNTVFTTNSQGLRDKEYSFQKDSGITRIVVLGDSYAWGFGVNDDEIFTEVLESMFEDVEVINLGVTGYGLYQEFLYLKLEGLKYDPDLVILSLSLNDIFQMSKLDSIQLQQRSQHENPNETEEYEQRGTADIQDFFNSVKTFLRENSYFYNFIIFRINTNKKLVKLLIKLKLKERLKGFEELDINLMPALVVYPENLARDFEKTLAFLLRIKNLLKKRGIRFVIVLIPSLESIDKKSFQHTIAYTIFDPKDFELEKPYQLIESFAKNNDIEVINPYLSFKKKHKNQMPLYLKNDIHFNKHGHYQLAKEIYSYLIKNGEKSPTLFSY